MIVFNSCMNCSNFDNKTKTRNACLAFKDIPEVILIGKNKHIKTFRNDNGILFTPVKENKNNGR